MKKYRRVISHDNDECAKFEEKLALGSKNDMTNLVNFNMLLWLIAYKVSAKKVRIGYLSWHWRVIQTLKKNLLFVWKMRWIIWGILTRALENLKMCTLMGYFCQRYVMFELKKYRQVVPWKMTYGFTNNIKNLVNFPSSWK